MSIKLTADHAARILVRAGRKADTARQVAEDARADFVLGAITLTDTLAAGVTASEVSESIKAELKGDDTLKQEVSWSVKWINNVAQVGRVLKLDGDLPASVGPRDVLALVRKIVDLGKDGGMPLVKRTLSDDKIKSQGAAVSALKSALKSAQDKKKKSETDGTDGTDGAGEGTGDDAGEGTSDGGSGVTVTAADLTPSGKVRAATALVVDALAAGTPDAETLAALVALADMIEDARAESESVARVA